MPEDVLQVPIFPLNTVVFPGGRLPLRIFEQRYLEMTKRCIRDSTPFGVCLIREGQEVGEPAQPYETGCLANIVSWDMPQLGIFILMTQGTRRLRILEQWTQPNRLRVADVKLLPEEHHQPLPKEHIVFADILRAVAGRAGESTFTEPPRYDDAAWVAYRLAELLPLENAVRQQLLEMADADSRLRLLTSVLAQQGLAT
ncbi:MAG: LON peptidase substrate-binding domain-containing protein [Burkholderiales bacterium]|nr:LON peptidase substrate-binding domain-containing protein [Betaproteobacteria bacterium]